MTQYTMIQPDDTPVHLVPDFASESEAQDFATSRGILGTITETLLWLSTPFQETANLRAAKASKVQELNAEGDRRSQLVHQAFDDVRAGHWLELSVENNRLTADGQAWGDVGAAWWAAVGDIQALPDVASVQAYDVVTDPSWP